MHNWELGESQKRTTPYGEHCIIMPAKCSVLGRRKAKALPQEVVDEMQTDLRKAARRECKAEEVKGAVGLINHLGKACFIQGLHNERIQTIIRSRGESILLSQGIKLSLEQGDILCVREESGAMGPL